MDYSVMDYSVQDRVTVTVTVTDWQESYERVALVRACTRVGSAARLRLCSR